MKSAFLLPLLLVAGCIHAPVPPPGPPPPHGFDRAHPFAEIAPVATPAQVASCNSSRNSHNILLVIAAGLSGLGGTGGAAALLPSTDKAAQIAIGLSALAAGATAALVGGFAGVAADNYAKSHCDSIVMPGALPPPSTTPPPLPIPVPTPTLIPTPVPAS